MISARASIGVPRVAASTLWWDSIIIAAMVVVSAYLAAQVLNLVLDPPPANEVGGTAILAGSLVLVVIALGFILWRSTQNQAET